jgi:hypothetical protein
MTLDLDGHLVGDELDAIADRLDAARADRAPTNNEVFSPSIRTQLQGPAGAAGQGFSESSATWTRLRGASSREATLGTSLAQGLDLQRCLA